MGVLRLRNRLEPLTILKSYQKYGKNEKIGIFWLKIDIIKYSPGLGRRCWRWGRVRWSDSPKIISWDTKLKCIGFKVSKNCFEGVIGSNSQKMAVFLSLVFCPKNYSTSRGCPRRCAWRGWYRWLRITNSGCPGYAVMRILGVFQNFYAVIFIMRLCGYPHNFVSWFATFCKNSFNFTQFESLFTYNWIHFCNFFGDSKYKKHLRIIVYHPYHFFKDFTNQRTAILLYHLHIPIILR